MLPQYAEDTERYLIFESDLSEYRTREILNKRGVFFKVVDGRYKCISTKAFVINIRNALKIIDLIKNQNAVLELSSKNSNGLRKAIILNKDHTETMLGDFKPVTEEYAKTKESYTYDPEQKQYFVAEQ